MNSPDRRDMLWSFSIPLFLFGGMSVFFAWHHRAEDDRWLAEQESVVASVAADRIDTAHDGYLVHAVGRLTYAPGGYTDPWSGQTHGGFALVRRAEVFNIPPSEDGTSPPPSWMSNGGQAVFGDTPEATDPTRTVVWLPPAVRLGAFTLDPRLVPRIVGNAIGIRPERYVGGNEFTPPEQARNQLLSGVSRLAAVPVPDGTAVGGWRSEGGWLYSPPRADGSPLGRRRVQYLRFDLPTDTVTLLARQTGDRLEPMPRPEAPEFAASWSGEVGVSDAFDAVRRRQVSGAVWRTAVGVVLLLAGVVLVWLGVRTGGVTSSAAGRSPAGRGSPPAGAPAAPG